jgi:hypothetical protein
VFGQPLNSGVSQQYFHQAKYFIINQSNMTRRKKIPQNRQDEIITLSSRRCCLCFGINSDLSPKKGQIAHLDQNSENNDIDNLAWLCLDHHDEYDSRTSQSKGLTIGEVKQYRAKLYEAVERDRQNVLLTSKSPSQRKVYTLVGGFTLIALVILVVWFLARPSQKIDLPPKKWTRS